MRTGSVRLQSGFSLIEVLVAITILVIGLLGLAGLQLASLRWTTDANQGAAIARLGQELAEKIRARPGQADAFVTAASGTPTVDVNCYSASGCSSAAGIATDIAEWRGLVAAALPGGAATLCRDTSPGDGSVAAPACSGGANDPLVMKFWWSARDTRGSAPAVASLNAPVAFLPLRP